MRHKIHGWIGAGVLFGVGCIGIAALPASQPGEGGSTPKVPHLLLPPSHAGASEQNSTAATISRPIQVPSGLRAKTPSTRTNARLQPVIQSAFESSESSQIGNAASNQNNPPPRTPVTQFVKQYTGRGESQQAQPPGVPRRDMQQPQPGEIPSFIGQVDVQALNDLGVIILRGSPQDVENMRKIIEEIQRISEGVEPFIRVFQLERAAASQVRDRLQELYSGATSGTSGTRTTTGGSTTTQGGSQSSAVLQTSVLRRFQVSADERTNTLIVLASPQMMDELTKVIQRLDVDGAPIVNEVRVFRLKNAEATEVANNLTQAISGQAAGTAGETIGGTAATVAGGGEPRLANRSAVIKFVPLEGEEPRETGILDEVRVTALIRTNSVLVSAPASSMPLLTAIIAELDKPPSIVATMKVFELKYADATNMRLTLAELFDLEATTTTGGLGGAGGLGNTNQQFQRPIATSEGNQPPVSLRVAVDERTNSLIVTGPENAVLQVEAVIRRLDLSDLHNRKSTVYRLKNSQASDVALALTQFFTNKRTIESQQAGVTAGQGTIVGAFQRLEQDIVVVALDNTLAATLFSATNTTNTLPANVNTQGVSNLLLISASPRNYDQVMGMIEQLDAPQPQVMIQVIVAQLTLSDDFEFGIEFGFQNDVLFDRGGNTTTPTSPGSPGFNFNSTSPLGNTNVVHPAKVGLQSLSNFTLGRMGIDDLGGMILTASSDSVSAMLRALQINRKLEVISRPQIMTLDGRTARITVGESFPYVGAVTQSENFVTPQITFLNIGVILTVKPSITPDDRIYLEVVPEVTELLNLVPFDLGGGASQEVPRTSVTAANTVVSVNDGQTIVMGGLIQKRSNDFIRKIPWLGDLPYLGFLFRYTQEREQKQELLIIMTPHIVRNDSDAQRIKDVEVARVNWILCEAGEMHGDLGLGQTVIEELPTDSVNNSSDQSGPAIKQMSGVEPVSSQAVAADLTTHTVAKPVAPTANKRESPTSQLTTKPQGKSLSQRIKRVLGKHEAIER